MKSTYAKVGHFDLIDAIMDSKIVYDKNKEIKVNVNGIYEG